MKLTAKQQMFAKEYLIDLNATQAAMRAGYSEKTAYRTGADNLRKPQIALAIQEAMDERSEKTGITAETVLNDIARVRDHCMGRISVPIYKTDKNGVKQKIGEKPDFNANGALKALELLGKHLKLFTDKMEFAGKDGGAIQHGIVVSFVKSNGLNTADREDC